ncbi:alpha/beta fold hydrolase [Kitasatospora sp. NPDC058190]|uniref:alpha/beta fold hydrolase n=1 Tax=Kitasatospora sp. NPDC058190 TaxID=3346371 RepID=UPI0036DAFE0E
MPYATVQGTRLFYRDHGAGRPLLFVHGWATSGRVWEAQLADLAADHRVIALDCRGCGRSDRPEDGHTLAANVADLLCLIDVLDLDSPVLVGSSIGATFALAAAAAAPELVGGVVSVDGSGHWPGTGMVAELRELSARLAADRAALVREWIPTWYGTAAGPELHQRTIGQILDSSPAVDNLFTEAAAYDPRGLLPTLDLPIAFLHGDQETQIPLEVSRTLADLAPHGSLHVVEGSGHMIHEEQPAAFNRLLRAVVRDMTGAAVG